MDASSPDTGTAIDAETRDGCTREGFTAWRELALGTGRDIEGNGEAIAYVAYSSSDVPYDRLLIHTDPRVQGPLMAGTYALDEVDPENCAFCVTLDADCDSGRCAQTFYPQEGTLEVAEIGGLGGRLEARITDAVFAEVTWNEETFTMEPLEDGDTWCLDEYAITEAVVLYDSNECERPDRYCIYETVPDFELQNRATEEMVSIRDVVDGEDGDLGGWLILTGGWCGACASWLQEVLPRMPEEMDKGINYAIIVGEDVNYLQPSLESCRSYAAQYGSDGVHFYIDHNGTSPFAETLDAIWYYAGSFGEFGLPLNAMIEAGTYEYVWSDAADEGPISEGFRRLGVPQ